MMRHDEHLCPEVLQREEFSHAPLLDVSGEEDASHAQHDGGLIDWNGPSELFPIGWGEDLQVAQSKWIGDPFHAENFHAFGELPWWKSARNNYLPNVHEVDDRSRDIDVVGVGMREDEGVQTGDAPLPQVAGRNGCSGIAGPVLRRWASAGL